MTRRSLFRTLNVRCKGLCYSRCTWEVTGHRCESEQWLFWSCRLQTRLRQPTVAWWSEPIGLVFELGNGEGFRKSKGHRRHSISESLTAGKHCIHYFKNWLSIRNLILVSKQKWIAFERKPIQLVVEVKALDWKTF